MKYEMIFGDEALFDSLIVPDYVEVIRINDYSKEYLFGDLNTVKLLTSKELKAIPIVAMRRIIKETKRWTWEDKKAGRLPDVGCRVDFCHKLNTNWRTGEIKYIDNQVAVIKADDIDRPFVYEFDRVEFNPIESPAEKAKRERDEWVDHAIYLYVSSPKNDVSSMGDVYDALLSGELPMPKKISS